MLTAAYAGLRWGELAGLKLSRVNFLRRSIDVLDVLTEANGMPARSKQMIRQPLDRPSHITR